MSDHTPTQALPPYPVPAAYGPPVYAPPVVFRPLRAPSGLATAAVVLAWIYAGLQVVAFLMSWSAAEIYTAAGEVGLDSAYVLTEYDYVGVLMIPVGIAAYVVSCLWLHRSRKVAEIVSPQVPHARARVWVWLGWVVPIVNLWFPLQVVSDIRRGSRLPDSGLLGVWWTAWLVTVVADRVASGLLPWSGVPDPALATALPWVELLLTVATLVALGLWLTIVRDVRRAQREILGA